MTVLGTVLLALILIVFFTGYVFVAFRYHIRLKKKVQKIYDKIFWGL